MTPSKQNSSCSVTIHATAQCSIDKAWDVFVPVALPDVFPRGKGPIPAVVAVTDQTASRWDTVGTSRSVHLSDKSIVTETITHVRLPSNNNKPAAEFGYRVSGFARPLSWLATEAHGYWTFTPDDNDDSTTRIAWRYTFTPRLSSFVLSLLVQTFWKAYMTDGLANVVRLMEEETTIAN